MKKSYGLSENGIKEPFCPGCLQALREPQTTFQARLHPYLQGLDVLALSQELDQSLQASIFERHRDPHCHRDSRPSFAPRKKSYKNASNTK